MANQDDFSSEPATQPIAHETLAEVAAAWRAEIARQAAEQAGGERR